MKQTFEEFKESRRKLNKLLKLYLKGTIVWPSGPSHKYLRKLMPDVDWGDLPRGKTYKKKEHGELSRAKAAQTRPESRP